MTNPYQSLTEAVRKAFRMPSQGTTTFVNGTTWGSPPTSSWTTQILHPSADVPVSDAQLDSYEQFVQNRELRRRMSAAGESGEEFYNLELSKLLAFRGKSQKGLIGLELEVEGKELFNTPFKYWSCHVDNSLREHDGHPPIEYVLKAPLSVEDTESALKYLNVKLKEAGSSLVMSNRTSVHVHVNCQELTVRQLYCFILLYLIFEEVLVDWSSPERAGNLFCLRAKDTDFYLQMLEQALKKKSLAGWKEDMRYAACNVSAIPKFGSLEFRSLKGTVDSELIMTWVKMLTHLKTVSLTYDNPIKIVEEFNQLGPLPFFRQTFPNDKMRDLLSQQPDLSSKLWEGLRMMRDVAYSVDWKKPLPVTKKKEQPPSENPPVEDNFEAQEVSGWIPQNWFGINPAMTTGIEIETIYGRKFVHRYYFNGDYHGLRVALFGNYNHTHGPERTVSIHAGTTLYYLTQNIYYLTQNIPTWLIVDVRHGDS